MKDLENKIWDIISEYGIENVKQIVDKKYISISKENVLTIVSNMAVHRLPKEILMGDVFIASYGNLNFKDEDSIKKSIYNVLSGLSKKLKEKEWSMVYLIMHGHPIITVNIKLMVYRICRIETIDYFYSCENGYIPINIKMRDIAIGEIGEIEE